MNFSLYIAKRYLFSKSSSNAINIMSFIASGGVIIATAALFIVLSVFAGLRTFSLQFTSFVDPDLKLIAAEGKSFIFSEQDHAKLLEISGITAVSKTIEERVIIKSENKSLLATLKGVDSHFTRVTNIDSMVTRGQWITPNTNDVVSGWGISNKLSFGLFNFKSPLSLYVPKPGEGQISSLNNAYSTLSVNNVGLFEINAQLHNEYVFSDISLAKALLKYGEHQITAIELKLKPDIDESTVRNSITNVFKDRFLIKNRVQLNDALYKMLNTENIAVYLIFTLVIIIALFNVIGAMIMMILDKKTSLITLFNIGTEISKIKSIFFLQGTLMTLVSSFIGIVLGLLIVGLQKTFSLVMITPEYAYPVDIKLSNLCLVLATIFVLGVTASKLASQRITKELIKT